MDNNSLESAYLEELEDALYHALHYDDLTNILNRKAFEEQAEVILQQGDPGNHCFTITLVDINGFKFINNSLGYNTGDLILKEIANRLKTFYSERTIIARFMADKFLILFKGIGDIESAKEMSYELKMLFDKPFNIDEIELYITASMGTSVYPKDGNGISSLIKKADIAINIAKTQGINSCQFYNAKENRDSYNKFLLTNDLRRAIERNEFLIKYQPKIDPRSNKIIGGEALIRWNHSSKGILSPNDFLNIAEEMELMIPMGQWMLQQVCSQIRLWKKEGVASVRISINFLEAQLQHKDFCSMLENVLRENNVDARFLEIEVIKGAIKENEETLITILKKIKELGVHVSIDDFGSGYSSLSKLRNFSVSTIKLAPEFIKSISEHKEDLQVVSAVIKLAHDLKMEITVGGVETLEQLSILTKLKCDAVQGYLFSEPVFQDKFKSLLKLGKCHPKVNKDIDDDNFDNRRDFFRITFKKPLGADMSIFKVDGKKVVLGYTEVVVFDIGAGGLRFLSNIKLPVKSDVVLIFETEILEEQLNLYGKIVWMKHNNGVFYEYGLEFVCDEKNREAMIQLLNQLHCNIKNKRGVDNYRLVK